MGPIFRTIPQRDPRPALFISNHTAVAQVGLPLMRSVGTIFNVKLRHTKHGMARGWAVMVKFEGDEDFRQMTNSDHEYLNTQTRIV
jgi:hypothetical protein